MEHDRSTPETDAAPERARPEKEQATEGTASRAGALLSVQRRAGNRAAQALLRSAQPKLVVGHASDPAEHEADRVAAEVTKTLRASRSVDGTAPGASRIARRSDPGAAGGDVDPDTERRLGAARGSGRPLPSRTRESMEGAFGADFRNVRVHSGRESTALNEQLSARAFTLGSEIFFRGPVPDASGSGGELLAHELAHVVQQSGGSSAVRRQVIRRAYAKGSAAEDAKLFDMKKPIPDAQVTPIPKAAADKGITSTNLGHYLERHTYMYQKLNSKTVSPAAGMFPHGTTADDVKKYLLEAMALIKDTDTIGTSPVSLTVDLKGGLKVNMGALKNGELSAFFPMGGTGFVKYEADELKAIKAIKNPAPQPVAKKVAGPVAKAASK